MSPFFIIDSKYYFLMEIVKRKGRFMKEENIKKIQDSLNEFLGGCSICKAKMCGFCPNNKRKKALKLELKELGFEESSSKNTISAFISKIKNIFR